MSRLEAMRKAEELIAQLRDQGWNGVGDGVRYDVRIALINYFRGGSPALPPPPPRGGNYIYTIKRGA